MSLSKIEIAAIRLCEIRAELRDIARQQLDNVCETVSETGKLCFKDRPSADGKTISDKACRYRSSHADGCRCGNAANWCENCLKNLPLWVRRRELKRKHGAALRSLMYCCESQ